jgi:hypothetical protein
MADGRACVLPLVRIRAAACGCLPWSFLVGCVTFLRSWRVTRPGSAAAAATLIFAARSRSAGTGVRNKAMILSDAQTSSFL